MYSKHSRRLTGTLVNGHGQNPSEPSLPATIDRIQEVIAESNELGVRLNEYKLSEKDLAREAF